MSKNIILTALRKSDSSTLYKWINDREQVLFNSSYQPISELQHEDWFSKISHRNDTKIFAIKLSTSDKLIGSCQLHTIDSISHSAELQIRIGDIEERKKGYGSEAVRLLLDFGFNDLNLHRIYLQVFENNNVAIKLYEKMNFKREGLLRDSAFINGNYVNVIVMGILRHEYEA